MGTPVPPNEPRTACSLCWGPNPIIGPIQPRWIYVTVSGCVPGETWNPAHHWLPNVTAMLEHVSGCGYRRVEGDIMWQLSFVTGWTRLLITHSVGGQLFDSPDDGRECALTVVNRFQPGWTAPVWGGTGHIWYPTEGL